MADALELEDIRKLNEAELLSELEKLKREQFNLRFQQASGQLEKTSRIRDVRRTIARIKTIMRQKKPQQKV